MKCTLSFAAAALALAALTAPQAVAQNLLVNPGFEDPVTMDGPPFVGFWEAFNGAGASSIRDTVDPRSGVGHLSLNTIDNNTFAGAFQDVVVAAGQPVTFSVYHKTTALPYTIGTEMRIEWRDAANELSRTANLTTAPSDAYSLLSLSAVAPLNATFARVVYAIQTFGNASMSDIGTVYVDDASVTVIPEPSTLALVGASLLGMVAIRRRRS